MVAIQSQVYLRLTYGHSAGLGASKTVTLGPTEIQNIASIVNGVIMSDAYKDSFAMDIRIQPEPFVDSPDDAARLAAEARIAEKLSESSAAGRMALPNEDRESYIERTTRLGIWPSREFATNCADTIFGPSQEALAYAADSQAQLYRTAQATRASWDRLTPDEKRQLCRHMETTWEGTRFWNGVHRFTE